MSLKLSIFQEDPQRQENGTPIFIDKDNSDATISVKRAAGFEYQKEIAKIKRTLYGFDIESINPDEVMANWLAEFGVTGWSGLIGEDDKPLKFTKSNSRALFKSKEYWNSLNTKLIMKASDYNNYLTDKGREDLEELKKL